MRRAEACGPGAARPVVPARRSRGSTLMELMVVVSILGILVAWASPRFELAVEQTRVDAAAAALRSVWIGQRMHCLEHGTYASDLAELEEQRFVDGALLTVSDPFAYALVSGGPLGFEARAVRGGSLHWTGTLGIDEEGVLTGSVQDGEGHVVLPTAN